MMSYTLATLWHGRQRFVPAVLAVAFSALLVAVQCGLMLGALSIVSLPIDHTQADIWVGAPGFSSIDVTRPIPESWRARFNMPEVERTELFIRGIPLWQKPNGGAEPCIVIGSRLEDGALGVMGKLGPELRARLTEPGSIVVNEEDLPRLGLRHGVGETGELGGQRVRVVGLVRGYRGISGVYAFCSIETAQKLLRLPADQATFLLVRCKDPALAPRVIERLRKYREMTALTTGQFSFRSRCHWLFRTGAGVALGLAVALGLLVGAVVTSQTLYAAVAGCLREYAVLRAMGIPRWRMAAGVMTQSLWIGVAGVALALPITFGLAPIGTALGAPVHLPAWLLCSAVVLTIATALISGLAALRALRLAEPAVLLR